MYMHPIERDRLSIPTLPCMCANLRRASRVLTQLYEDALRPLGLRATQFTVLQALSLAGEVTQGASGPDPRDGQHHADPDTRHLWSAAAGSQSAVARIAANGGSVCPSAARLNCERALPHWRSVQRRVHAQLANEAWEKPFQR